MAETERKGWMTELKRNLGEEATDESAKEAISKILLYHPLQASDDEVAEKTGLPLMAVTLVRTLLRNLALAEAESEKKSRLGVHNPRLQLPVMPIPGCINQTKRTYTQTYRSWCKKRVSQEGKSHEA